MVYIPKNVLNPELYKKAKKKADETFERSGLFKSAFIQKEYQKLGGKYSGPKPKKTEGIQRWLSGEQWVEVEPYIIKGEIVKCGTSEKMGKACRPLKRINDNTPSTLPELIKIHGKKKLLLLVKQKQKDMDGTLKWKEGKFISSKKSKK